MKRIIFALSLALVVTYSYADPKGVTTRTSGFDGRTEISLKPYGTSSCMPFSQKQCISVGAFWVSDLPEFVALDIFALGELISMPRLLINIDGDIIQAEMLTNGSNSSIVHLYKESSQRFAIKKSDFEKILSAKKVWLKIETMNGTYIETNLIDSGKETLAFKGLGRFATQLK